MLSSFIALAAAVASVSAHATFQEMWINGVDQGGYCVRLPQNNNPVTDVTSTSLACNLNALPANGKCTINPGDTITVEMHQQPADRTCANEAIGGDHWGPIMIYLAKVSDSSTAVGSSSSWFKIAEAGLPSSNPDYWATEVLNDNCGHYTFKIPTGIAPGDYLLRAEVIALHVAFQAQGAQFYMSCFQVTIGGTGTAAPPTVKLPGAYSANDPGILINIYSQLNGYTIPGPTAYNFPSPAVATTAWPTTATWNTAGQPTADPTTPPGGSKPTTTSSTKPGTTTTPPTTTSKTTTTTKSTSTTSTASGATQTKYGQCGGQGWTVRLFVRREAHASLAVHTIANVFRFDLKPLLHFRVFGSVAYYSEIQLFCLRATCANLPVSLQVLAALIGRGSHRKRMFERKIRS